MNIESVRYNRRKFLLGLLASAPNQRLEMNIESVRYNRRKFLLGLLASAPNQRLEKIAFQKILFLLGRPRQTPLYHFVPYKYGPFSWEANMDMSVLSSDNGLVAETQQEWILAKKEIGKKFISLLGEDDKKMLKEIFSRLYGKSKSSDWLIVAVYKKHPYYAIKSEWQPQSLQARKERHSVQRLVQNEKRRIQAQRESALFTLGYEEASIDAYLNALVRNNISILCDVRKNPLSRKYGFSKNKLSENCRKLGMQYAHIGDLGIASALRRKVESRADTVRLLRHYARALRTKEEFINQISEWFAQENRVVLTCFEKAPEDCHRSVLANAVGRKAGIDVNHLSL